MVLENSSNDGLHQLMCLWLLCLHILSSCICKACLTKVRVFIERSVIGRPSTCIFSTTSSLPCCFGLQGLREEDWGEMHVGQEGFGAHDRYQSTISTYYRLRTDK
jgi:hypothetical protein